MDKLRNAFRKFNIKNTAAAVALIIIGIMFIIFPNSSATVLCYVAGAFLMLWGILNLISFFLSDMKRVSSGELVIGLTLVCLAILLFTKPGLIAGVLTVIFGITLIIDGGVKLQQFIFMRSQRIKSAWVVLAIAIISLVLGILLAFDPFSSSNVLMIYAGVSLIVSGVLDLIAGGFTSNVDFEKGKTVIDLDDDDIIIEDTDD